jgi:hypothetical protein
MKAIATALLFALPLAVAAQVYKSHDEQGNPVFSDNPNSGGQPIDIPRPNTLPGMQPKLPDDQEEPDQEPSYHSITIVSPHHDSIIRNGLAPFTVTIDIQPSLKPNHQIRLSIDGQTYSTGTDTERMVERIGRGSHQLQASIIDGSATVIKTSPAITVFAYWPGGR